MRKEFLQLPAQAIMAELHNVEPLGKVSGNEISKKYTRSQYNSHCKIFQSLKWTMSPFFIVLQKTRSLQTFSGNVEMELENAAKQLN